MTRTEAKAWADDQIESIAKCVFTHREIVRNVRIRARRFTSPNTVEVTCGEGYWSAVFTPKASGLLVLESFVFGQPPGVILLPLDVRSQIEKHFDVEFRD